MKEWIERYWPAALFIVLFVGASGLVITHAIMDVRKYNQVRDLSDLPTNLAIKVQTGDNYFLVVDMTGRRYRISEIDWKNMELPLKLADGLYQLPDGAYVGGIAKDYLR